MNALANRIGVVSTALSTDARQAAALAHTNGFSGLLFDAYSPQLNLPDLSATGRREFLQVLRAQNVQLVGLQGELGPKGLGPGADVDRVLHRAEAAMESAAALMAPLLCVDVGRLPETFESLVELGHRAERYSVTVAFSSSLASFKSLESALRAANCPWFGIDLDPVAILRDSWDADEIFSRLGKSIRHVRVRDAVLGADKRTKPALVGQGSTDWPALLARLDAAGYSGWLTIDPMAFSDRLGAAIATLKALL